MDVFLGFCPDLEANNSIRKVVRDLNHVFDEVDIPVRWTDPKFYHLSIISFGQSISLLKRVWLKYKLKNVKIKPFKVVFNTSKLGISRKYKELIYLDLKNGGEEMRDILFELRHVLGIEDSGNFIPHLVLGRVSKDLTAQEYTNISKDLYRVGKSLNIDDIQFYVNGLQVIKLSSKGIEILFELGSYLK